MQVEVKDITGKAVKKVDLPDEIFALEMNEPLLHLVVKAYLANKRQGTHATKTRSLVSGGGKKPFKQKGTGNARQGSIRSPHMKGGAVVLGPQPRDYRQYMSKNTRQQALRVALSEKVRHKKLIIIDDFKVSQCKTKHIVGALDALKAPSALLVDERKDEFLYRSTRNIHKARALNCNELNAMNVLRYEAVILTENALNSLRQRLEGGKRESV